uniref:Uncharacterized protein n=1 Tax=viral metagenome TaxID=1070528 RepID=A0A6C0CS26_9ZZZZ
MEDTSALPNEDMQKAYEQLLKRRAYSAEYMKKFRAERRDEYNAQRRALYARKKAKEKEVQNVQEIGEGQ